MSEIERLVVRADESQYTTPDERVARELFAPFSARRTPWKMFNVRRSFQFSMPAGATDCNYPASGKRSPATIRLFLHYLIRPDGVCEYAPM